MPSLFTILKQNEKQLSELCFRSNYLQNLKSRERENEKQKIHTVSESLIICVSPKKTQTQCLLFT